MPTSKPKSTGRTLWDLLWDLYSEVLVQKSVFRVLGIAGWAVLAVLGYLWFVGKVGLVDPAAAKDQSAGSPYLHWWTSETSLPLNECESFIGKIYRLTGPTETESPVLETSSIAQVGVAGEVTSAIICIRTGDKTVVSITAAGPQQTKTNNREAQLRDAVQSNLKH